MQCYVVDISKFITKSTPLRAALHNPYLIPPASCKNVSYVSRYVYLKSKMFLKNQQMGPVHEIECWL